MPHLRAVPDEPVRVGLDAAPPWVDGAWTVAEDCRRAFSHGASLTVGLEEELILLEPTTLQPADEIENALVRLEDDRFTCELRSAQLEIVMPPCVTVSDACRELRTARAFAADRLAGFTRIAAAGVHPNSTLPIEVTGRDRYQGIAADYPWSVREGMPSGLHVHVAVSGPARALAVYNAVRSYLPELAALAANSPFLGGRDTGLASSRLKLNESLPRAGSRPRSGPGTTTPSSSSGARPAATSRTRATCGGTCASTPCTERSSSGSPTPRRRAEEAGAVAAVCQALVAALGARFDAGEELPVHDTHRINENRWTAVRDGLDGRLADLDTGVAVPTRSRIETLLTSLEPYAEALGSRNELLAAWTMLAENGAERQRRIAAESGVLEVVRRLADETELGEADTWPLELRTAGRRL